MIHHNWDLVLFHGHSCVVECEWDAGNEGTQEHWLMIRPMDGSDGTYVVTESQLEVNKSQEDINSSGFKDPNCKRAA